MTDEEKQQQATERALENLLLRMGVDPDDKQAFAELRENLAFLARFKRGTGQISNAIIKTCVGAAVLGVLWLLVMGFRDWIALLPPFRAG